MKLINSKTAFQFNDISIAPSGISKIGFNVMKISSDKVWLRNKINIRFKNLNLN